MSIKKLPDAEFEIMRAVWHSEEPVTSPQLTDKLSHELPEKDWKQQTVMTMLVRLEKKGFLRSDKAGKERNYYAEISESDYLQVEADSFRKRFNGGRISGLVKALYSDESISDEDISELKDWINKL
ncbi:MAG: BlaI/MecI/CopY family transcriptional regulator [Ruminococcus sp.]|nr:BlaI/MecI/CopY family transcriptional regulator [Ruminococcus sp.]